MTDIKKIYPSSAAFMSGPLVDSKKSNSCHRYMWAVAHTDAPRQNDVDPAYAGIGALDEARLAAQLTKKRVKFEREVPFKIPFKDVIISGRYDFDIAYKDGPVILEKKASTSDYVKKDHLDTGIPDSNHVAQLVMYLLLHKREKGHLHLSYYELSPEQDAYVVAQEKVWLITVSEQGDVLVDGKQFGFNAADLRRWLVGAHDAITIANRIPPEPRLHSIPYKNPCYFCPLKDVCAAHKENEKSSKVFLQEADTALRVPRVARPFKIRTQNKNKVIVNGKNNLPKE
jgi:hypothetical protein